MVKSISSMMSLASYDKSYNKLLMSYTLMSLGAEEVRRACLNDESTLGELPDTPG